MSFFCNKKIATRSTRLQNDIEISSPPRRSHASDAGMLGDAGIDEPTKASKRSLQTLGFLLTLPSVDQQLAGVCTDALGVAAMRKSEISGEKPSVKRKYLTPDQARRVIEASSKVGRQGDRDKLLLTLIYRHGLRVSEAVDLRWSDFDLDAPKSRTLYVRRLKGSKDATHTLEPDTVRMLKRAQADADGLYVFRSERGGPMSVDTVQLIVKRAGEVAGLEFQIHPHMLRHACGFTLAEAGTDTRLIQDYLGHKDIKNTVVYTETSARRLASVRVR
jgi:integrase